MAETISWVATIATIIAASMTASNLGTRITGYGFCVFLVGSLSWLTSGLMSGQTALVWTNVVLTVLNAFGIWRWLGRQTRIEEGATSAEKASERSAGETLFPVSILIKAPVIDRRGKALGTCVDAMAGCDSGLLSYVVTSQGGVAGLGETLRRVPWSETRVQDEKLILEASDFGQFQEIAREEWPAN